jgi:predicted Fe-S protein YdhL (DUF1289 family)
MNDAPPVESPCIKVCVLDASGEVCIGCLRTLDEIGHWAQLSNAQRSRIVEKLPGRRERSGPTPSAPPSWTAQRCEGCGAGFSCGAEDPQAPCWCAAYPAVAPSRAGARCLCPECLAAVKT